MSFTPAQRLAFLEAGMPPEAMVPTGKSASGDLLYSFRDIWLLTRPQLQAEWDRHRTDIDDPDFWAAPQMWFRSGISTFFLWYDTVMPWLLPAFADDTQTLEEMLAMRDPDLNLAFAWFKKKCLRGRPKPERYSDRVRGEVIFQS